MVAQGVSPVAPPPAPQTPLPSPCNRRCDPPGRPWKFASELQIMARYSLSAGSGVSTARSRTPDLRSESETGRLGMTTAFLSICRPPDTILFFNDNMPHGEVGEIIWIPAKHCAKVLGMRPFAAPWSSLQTHKPKFRDHRQNNSGPCRERQGTVYIKNFGLFWRADEVDWYPGGGVKGAFRLLGRQGKYLPGLRLADFRYQQGIYILYGNYGPYYTGITKQGFGRRLQDHLGDDKAEQWDRFSWFGFQQVKIGADAHGICMLRDLAGVAVGDPSMVINDVEALLIRAMGLSNIAQTQFSEADEWIQVKLDEREHYLEKVAPK